MKSKILAIGSVLFLSFYFVELKAQEVISASGGEANGGGGSVSYSVGQVVYSSNKGINGTVSQGVQQAFEIFEITNVEEVIDLKCLVYPNPTIGFLTLQVKGEDYGDLFFQLFDMTGKLVEREKIVNDETNIVMNGLGAGIYVLKVVQTNPSLTKEIQAFKIIKN